MDNYVLIIIFESVFPLQVVESNYNEVTSVPGQDYVMFYVMIKMKKMWHPFV